MEEMFKLFTKMMTLPFTLPITVMGKIGDSMAGSCGTESESETSTPVKPPETWPEKGRCKDADAWKLFEYTLVKIQEGGNEVLKQDQLLVSGDTTPEEVNNQVIATFVRNHVGQGIDGRCLRVYKRELDRWCSPDHDC